MINDDRSSRLEMRWLPMQSNTGRTQMVATWVTVDTALQTAASHAA